ncbi:MAG: hypothetical protein AB7E32_11250 [Desulfovibrio sp.]
MPIPATENDPAPLFSSRTEIPYDLRFPGTVLDWAAGLATLAGGNRREADALRLALDEILTYLINAYPDAEPWERIRAELRLLEEGLVELEIINVGPPMHPERIAHYNPAQVAEEDLDGLWYFLAQQAVDELSFLNRGMDGWQVLIRKRLAEPSFQKKPPTNNPGAEQKGKITFTTRFAVPEDATELVNLAFDTYRYSYADETFYSEKMLRGTLEEKQIIAILVEANGVIVGNSAFSFSPRMPRCVGSGSLMVRRAFRQSRAIIHLLNAISAFINENTVGADLYYATVVTTHTGSQKAGAREGWKPLALILSLAGAVDFRGIKHSGNERESYLVYVRPARLPEIPVLHLPQRHHEVMAPLLAQAGYHSALSAQATPPLEHDTRFFTEEFPEHGSAFLTVAQLGQDFAIRLKKKIFSLNSKGMRTVIIYISACRSIPPDLDNTMAHVNAIFTGLKPVSAHECLLVYCALPGAVDFDCIRVIDPLALRLREHCRALYEEIALDEQE